MTEPLETRRKRLVHRSLYTGMKETDLLLGAFARARLGHFSPEQLDRYEALLGLNEDPRIYAWAIGRETVPTEHDHDVMAELQAFSQTYGSSRT